MTTSTESDDTAIMNTFGRFIRHLGSAFLSRGFRLAVLGCWLTALAAASTGSGKPAVPRCGAPASALEPVLSSAQPLEIYQACFVNAVRFVAIFREMAPTERAEIIRVNVRVAHPAGSRLDRTRTEAHALVAFTCAQRNYLWDHALGILDAPAGCISSPDYAQAAERALQQRVDQSTNGARDGGVRLTPAPARPKTDAEKRAALQHLFSGLPSGVSAYRLEMRLADGRTVEGAAIIFDQYFGVYLPDRGTLLSARTDRRPLEIDDPSPLIREAITDVDRARILNLQVTRALSTAPGPRRSAGSCC